MKNHGLVLRMWMVLLTLFVAGELNAQDVSGEGGPQGGDEALTRKIEEVLARSHVPGAVVVMLDGGGQPRIRGFGQASLESRQPVTAETLFRVGSISKMLVSLVLLKLEQEGRVSLQAPIKSLVPEVDFVNEWESQHPVRVIHLVEHTTGWDDLSLHDYASNDPSPLPLAERLQLTAKSRVSRWVPGTQFAYSNVSAAVAAAIVEKVSGETFEHYVDTHLFGPIGMKTATYLEPEAGVPASHIYHSDGRTPYPYHHLILPSAGAVNASAEDMSALLGFFVGRGSVDGLEVLPSSAIEVMEKPESSDGAKAGLPVGHAKDLAIEESDGFVWRGHAGGIDGAVSDFAYLKEGRGYFFSLNGGQSGRAAAQLRGAIRSHLTRDLPRTPAPATGPVSEDVSEAFAGWYRPTNARLGMTDFLWRLLIARVDFDAKQMMVSPLLGAKQSFVPVTRSLFRKSDQAIASVALLDDRRMQINTDSFVRIATASAWLQIVILVLLLVFLVSSSIVGIFWLPVAMWRKKTPRNVMVVGAAPFIAAACLLGILIVLLSAGDDLSASLGQLSKHSVSLFILSIALPVAAFAGLWVVITKRAVTSRRFLYWHSLVASSTFSVVALYLLLQGVVAFRSWS